MPGGIDAPEVAGLRSWSLAVIAAGSGWITPLTRLRATQRKRRLQRGLRRSRWFCATAENRRHRLENTVGVSDWRWSREMAIVFSGGLRPENTEPACARRVRKLMTCPGLKAGVFAGVEGNHGQVRQENTV